MGLRSVEVGSSQPEVDVGKALLDGFDAVGRLGEFRKPCWILKEDQYGGCDVAALEVRARNTNGDVAIVWRAGAADALTLDAFFEFECSSKGPSFMPTRVSFAVQQLGGVFRESFMDFG